MLFTAILAMLTINQLIYTAFELLWFPRPALFASLPPAYQLNFALGLIEAVLSLSVISYIFLRSAKGKPMLDKNLFALLAAYLVFNVFSMDAHSLYINRIMNPDIQQTVMSWVNFAASNISYGIAATYSLWAYRGLRTKGIHEITTSKFLRVAFLIYGLSGLAYQAWWIITIPNYLERLFEPGLWAYGVFFFWILYYLAFTALAFVTLRLSVGKTPEVMP